MFRVIQRSDDYVDPQWNQPVPNRNEYDHRTPGEAFRQFWYGRTPSTPQVIEDTGKAFAASIRAAMGKDEVKTPTPTPIVEGMSVVLPKTRRTWRRYVRQYKRESRRIGRRVNSYAYHSR